MGAGEVDAAADAENEGAFQPNFRVQAGLALPEALPGALPRPGAGWPDAAEMTAVLEGAPDSRGRGVPDAVPRGPAAESGSVAAPGIALPPPLDPFAGTLGAALSAGPGAGIAQGWWTGGDRSLAPLPGQTAAPPTVSPRSVGGASRPDPADPAPGPSPGGPGGMPGDLSSGAPADVPAHASTGDLPDIPAGLPAALLGPVVWTPPAWAAPGAPGSGWPAGSRDPLRPGSGAGSDGGPAAPLDGTAGPVVIAEPVPLLLTLTAALAGLLAIRRRYRRARAPRG